MSCYGSHYPMHVTRVHMAHGDLYCHWNPKPLLVRNRSPFSTSMVCIVLYIEGHLYNVYTYVLFFLFYFIFVHFPTSVAYVLRSGDIKHNIAFLLGYSGTVSFVQFCHIAGTMTVGTIHCSKKPWKKLLALKNSLGITLGVTKKGLSDHSLIMKERYLFIPLSFLRPLPMLAWVRWIVVVPISSY